MEELNRELTEKLLGKPYVKVYVGHDNQVTLDRCGRVEVLKNSGQGFPFHTRLRELACFSPGSVYEFAYKYYPPSHYCSLNGTSDLLDFLVPPDERLHPEPFSSNGIHLYLINSHMEKFKLFKGAFGDDWNAKDDIRAALKESLADVYEYAAPGRRVEIKDLFHSRITYFGVTVVCPYLIPKVSKVITTMPGVALVGEVTDVEQLKRDFSFWLLKNHKVFETWKNQWQRK